MNNVGLFTRYLLDGESVRDGGSYPSVYHYRRWPIGLAFHMDRWHARHPRHWVSAHGIQTGWRAADRSGYERVFTTIYRFGPLLLRFGPSRSSWETGR